MNENKKIISYIGFGPSMDEYEYRDRNKLCTSLKYKDGETEFKCNNICNHFCINKIKVWIHQTMICDDCLEKLKIKYNIDFKYEIPRLYLSKNWNNEEYKNFASLPLIIELNKLLKDNPNFLDPEFIWLSNPSYLIG